MIRFDDVTKAYVKEGNTVLALENLSLEIPTGALALVSGPSGSGKSTFINLAAGLDSPSRGLVTVGGTPLDTLSQSQRTRLRVRSVAVVFQMFHLVPYLSALENVLLPGVGDSPQAVHDRASGLLEQLGLASRAGHLPMELSAGERQRCAVARALINDPDIILADEPTGNLDEESAGRVLEQLAACHASGKTVLIASHHHLDRIEAEHSFVLSEGQLASQD